MKQIQAKINGKWRTLNNEVFNTDAHGRTHISVIEDIRLVDQNDDECEHELKERKVCQRCGWVPKTFEEMINDVNEYLEKYDEIEELQRIKYSELNESDKEIIEDDGQEYLPANIRVFNKINELVKAINDLRRKQ